MVSRPRTSKRVSHDPAHRREALIRSQVPTESQRRRAQVNVAVVALEQTDNEVDAERDLREVLGALGLLGHGDTVTRAREEREVHSEVGDV